MKNRWRHRPWPRVRNWAEQSRRSGEQWKTRDASCVKKRYIERIAVLDAIVASASAPWSPAGSQSRRQPVATATAAIRNAANGANCDHRSGEQTNRAASKEGKSSGGCQSRTRHSAREIRCALQTEAGTNGRVERLSGFGSTSFNTINESPLPVRGHLLARLWLT